MIAYLSSLKATLDELIELISRSRGPTFKFLIFLFLFSNIKAIEGLSLVSDAIFICQYFVGVV